MERVYELDKVFEKISYAGKKLPPGDYENCRFVNCDFSSADLSYSHFVESEFVNCNISTVKMIKTVWRDIVFRECKMLGLLFDQCDHFLFSAVFERSTLDHSSFYGLKLKKFQFKQASLQEVDFTDADLSESIFSDCNLSRALFKNTVLEKADFSTSFNYSIDPELNKIRRAKFSLPSVIGLLDKYDIDIR